MLGSGGLGRGRGSGASPSRGPGGPADPRPLVPQKLAWEQQEPDERKLNFVPQQYRCLRAVPAYSRFIHERFERCLDLYLCPRQRKMRVRAPPTPLPPTPGSCGHFGLASARACACPNATQMVRGPRCSGAQTAAPEGLLPPPTPNANPSSPQSSRAGTGPVIPLWLRAPLLGFPARPCPKAAGLYSPYTPMPGGGTGGGRGAAWVRLTACLSQVNVDPEDLIPKLPKPRDLQPFPTTQALVSGGVEPAGGGGLLCVPVALGCA